MVSVGFLTASRVWSIQDKAFRWVNDVQGFSVKCICFRHLSAGSSIDSTLKMTGLTGEAISPVPVLKCTEYSINASLVSRRQSQKQLRPGRFRRQMLQWRCQLWWRCSWSSASCRQARCGESDRSEVIFRGRAAPSFMATTFPQLWEHWTVSYLFIPLNQHRLRSVFPLTRP